MTEKSNKYFSDILLAIQLVEDFTYDYDFNQFDRDIKTQRAVERRLGIIEEVLNQFNKLSPNILIENDKQIVALRNRLVHAYDSIDNSILG